ncbi:hypothetical protein SLE2022_266200 [Rubroshorea leprosula]
MLDEASVTEGMVRLSERPKKRAVSGKEGSTGKHLMLDGLEGDVRGRGTDSEDYKEKEGSRGTFKLGTTDEASGENNIECSTKSSTMEQRGVPNGPVGPAKEKTPEKGKDGLQKHGPKHEMLNPLTLGKPIKKKASKPSHGRNEEIDSFWKDMDSNSEGCNSEGMPNWTRKGEGKKKPR